ncbi:hypothetical protein QJS10_CPA01g01018 [Acorus calamus]|uniref:Uncharacterized protein n=1 Tax=Acorus calamus TaxID=4465 RepID=A0AAV9FJY2_ACOCL|nr:hypothetical protein QJS10_CPA01g01018 [Acorus calamus]
MVAEMWILLRLRVWREPKGVNSEVAQIQKSEFLGIKKTRRQLKWPSSIDGLSIFIDESL